jgi:tetratricopeptide (TPR) repeat protein
MRPEFRSIPGLTEQLAALQDSLAVDSAPRNVMRVAEALWISGRARDAARLLEPLVHELPNAISPRLLLGWCYEDCGLAEMSRKSLDIVRTLDPANPYLRPSPVKNEEDSSRESPKLEGERAAEPEAALTVDELRQVPPSPLYSGTLGQIFESQGFEEKAIEIYREVVRMNPNREDLLARIEALEGRAGEQRET